MASSPASACSATPPAPWPSNSATSPSCSAPSSVRWCGTASAKGSSTRIACSTDSSRKRDITIEWENNDDYKLSLRLAGVDPLLNGGLLVGRQPPQQSPGAGIDNRRGPMLRTNESRIDTAIEKLHERAVEPRDIEKAERLGVDPQLCPRPHFEDLFQ